ncbi:hypothetical protein [Parafrankia sp. FMc2]|uniref:hypothetical protein n=1 Tax=Parafrankia sp. FMc2 TaxID=3233196 RepID=UPI0034D7363F
MSEIETEAFFGAVLKAIACTRNHDLTGTHYEAGVLEPARRIREFEKKLEGRSLTSAESDQVLAWLDLIFRTKLTPEEERDYYHRRIAEAAGLSVV